MSLSAEQQELASTVRAVLAKHGDSAAVRRGIEGPRGYDEHLWQLLCEQVGVAALAIPEEFGGIGAGLVESLLVVEELGHTLSAPPMLGSAVLGVRALLLAGAAEANERLLPEVAEGARTLALCWAGRRGWDEFGVTVTDGKLTGTAHYVLDGAYADTLLVLTADGLFEVDGTADGVARTTVPTQDPSRRLAEIGFDGVAARRLGTVAVDRLRETAWLAVAAEQVGAAQRCLDLTVDYTGSRVQFGRPIGSFQALKHRMADMYVQVESARSIAHHAIAALAAGDVDPVDVAAARLYCTDALNAVVSEMVQMHGGIAITWEHDAHLFFKRAHGLAQLFGSPARPLARPA
ncbi:acyl-CoA dehydrogenase family protein [Nocardia otitidiscaviarum]|uniref:acyl-CoA dehydrogenase family protein n=1 Tax=Nocardia otitidiscaviarum TaxID=1823 RepID=UPI001895D90D|nr:acyl-CoA dehydrogenase family protein [Nocardia otitidiscaviarum]MBF6179245.1 acyl-CoA dehydrogenase family protein [Nocardia otitidiscaviarum]